MRQTMRCAAKWFAALLVMAALPGLAQAVELVRQDGTRIDVDATQLARLPQQTTSAIDHGTSRSFRGVDLRTLLAEAGIAMDKDMRGPELHTLVIVQARDGYRVVFALAELDPSLGNARMLLATHADGQPLQAAEGPVRLVIPDERRAARWVRQVERITLHTLD